METLPWSPPPVDRAESAAWLARRERALRRRRVWLNFRGCLIIPLLWTAGILVPAALTIAFGSLWPLALYAGVIGGLAIAWGQGWRGN